MIASTLSALLPGRQAETLPGPTDDFWYGPTGRSTPAGVDVTIDSAQRVSAVYGCMRILRESLGYLPFDVYEQLDEKSVEKAIDHPVWQLLHNQPNRWQTPMTFKGMGVNHLYFQGNFYCLIVGRGRNLELWPLNPDRMEVKQDENRNVSYLYSPVNQAKISYRAEEIYHVMGQTLNGICGVSVIEYARNAIGSTMAQETHGSSLFKNGGLPAFWIFRPPERKWTDQARRNFRKGWRRMHGGADNAGNPPILADGMELRELGLNNRDSQWIESRGLSAEEICRFFGVSPHMIGVKSTAPKSNTEQQALEFQMYTLTPLAARFEQAADMSLLVGDEKYYTKFNMDAQRRADTKSRHEAHNIAVQGGWKSINEVRALEELNPVDGGDEVRFPMNMQPAGGGPDENEQGGQPGKGTPKPLNIPKPEENQEANLRKSFSILIDEAAERIAAAEIKALSVRANRAAEDNKKWCIWLVDVYKKHSSYAKKTLEPIYQSWELSHDITASLDRFAQTCVVLLMGHPLVLPDTDVPALLETWKITRADELAITLKEVLFK